MYFSLLFAKVVETYLKTYVSVKGSSINYCLRQDQCNDCTNYQNSSCRQSLILCIQFQLHNCSLVCVHLKFQLKKSTLCLYSDKVQYYIRVNNLAVHCVKKLWSWSFGAALPSFLSPCLTDQQRGPPL